jgi:hypothetical protein
MSGKIAVYWVYFSLNGHRRRFFTHIFALLSHPKAALNSPSLIKFLGDPGARTGIINGKNGNEKKERES